MTLSNPEVIALVTLSDPKVPTEVREELTVETGYREEEDSKIIVTIHDINSPTSSSNDLQGLNDSQ